MRSGVLVFVALLGFASAAEASPARGRQVRKARLELARAIELEKGALSGSSDKPATDLHRAAGLRARARARLKMIDALLETSVSKPVRKHIEEARRHEASAQEIENDPGAQALFRQLLLDARGERDYWQRMGSYGQRRPPAKKIVSRSRPRLALREVENLGAANAANSSRAGARNLTAVRDAAQPASRPRMIRSRQLKYYWEAFGPVFQRRLKEMSGADLWIDVGAGRGVALADYGRWQTAGAQMLAIDLVDDARQHEARFPGRFRSLTGDVTTLRVRRSGQLLTDVFAAMSYGDAPDKVIRRYGSMLEPGGHAMLFVEEERNTVLARDGRSKVDLIGYLRRVEGFEVEDVRVFGEGSAVILRRTEAPVRAPRLELVEFKDGGPPTRVFRMPSARQLPEPLKSRFQPRVRAAY